MAKLLEHYRDVGPDQDRPPTAEELLCWLQQPEKRAFG